MYLNFGEFYTKYLNLDKFLIKEDNYIFYLWKPAGIPSSFGKNKSILDLLEDGKLDKYFVKNQINNFSKIQEYGLLNRLDNDTSGFLYFAKNYTFYEKFKYLQKSQKIVKIYYAMVKGNLNNEFLINYPIMHKNKTKMIVIKTKNDEKKGRGKKHFVETFIEPVKYNDIYTWLKVYIKKGIRHQIRVHLASIGFPIVGDKLYGGENSEKLYLFSVGLEN